jgi:hypothetical protein
VLQPLPENIVDDLHAAFFEEQSRRQKIIPDSDKTVTIFTGRGCKAVTRQCQRFVPNWAFFENGVFESRYKI